MSCVRSAVAAANNRGLDVLFVLYGTNEAVWGVEGNPTINSSARSHFLDYVTTFGKEFTLGCCRIRATPFSMRCFRGSDRFGGTTAQSGQRRV